MVAAESANLNSKSTLQGGARLQTPTRPPLLPSEPDNVMALRRPKNREATSRYMFSAPSTPASAPRRCPSPLVSRTPTAPAVTNPKKTPVIASRRSQSVERKWNGTPRLNYLDFRTGNSVHGGIASAKKMLSTSTRSLSVSFQGESFSLQVNKVKPPPSPIFRKGTPERRKTVFPAREGGGSSDQTRFPVRLGQGDYMRRSFDWMNGSGNVVRASQSSMAESREAFEGSLNSISSNTDLENETDLVADGNSGSGSDGHSDLLPSDAESASSETTTGFAGKGLRGPRGVVVPARFMQEHKPSSSSKLNTPKKLTMDSPPASVTTTPRGQPSPKRGINPSGTRNAVAATNTPSSNPRNESSILNFANEVRKGKTGENQVANAHLLRLFHNQLFQWRFVNAKADATHSAQTLNSERNLYNACISTSKLRESVKTKRYELQSLRQELKLASILDQQMGWLEDWDLLDQDFSTSLSGVTEALKASTLQLPVDGGAKGDLVEIKDAIASAVDVMQAMAASISSLSTKVGDVNSLALELADVSGRERALLYESREFLSIISEMQVEECSLRAQGMQMERPRSRAGGLKSL